MDEGEVNVNNFVGGGEMTSDKLTKDEQKWNDEVEEKIDSLDDLKEHLKNIYESESDFSWPDQLRAKRAYHYLELATLEMYSMQYEVPERLLLYWQDEQIQQN